MFIDRSIARRLETTSGWRSVQYAQAQSVLHLGNGSVIAELAGGTLVYAGQEAPVNRAYALGFECSIDSRDLAAVARFFLDHGIEPRVDLCPLADPSLQDQLRRMRYRLEAFYNVLCSPLDRPLPGVADPELRVAPVAPRDKGLWLKTVGQGFSGREDPPEGTLESLAPALYSPDTHLFLAWIGGEAVGGGALSEHGGTVELGAGSTRPGFRRRGVQAALIRARLAAARDMGCDLAMIVTSPGSDSQRNAQRLGFHLAYTKAVMVLNRRRRPGLQAG